MEALTTEFSFAPTQPWPVLIARLMGSFILCGLVGFEREAQNRPAGLRTHILTGLAATVYTLIMLELVATSYADSIRIDPMRIVESVTGGVAFLAAGLIVFAKGEVKGLTTGASMWLVASIGLAVGLGLWPLAVITTFLALVVVRGLKIVETAYME